MSLETIPESWLDTLENDEDVIAWRSSVDFPNSLSEIARHVSARALHSMVPQKLETMKRKPFDDTLF